MKRLTVGTMKLVSVFLILLWGSLAGAGEQPLHEAWGALLKVYVNNGVVDYQGFKKDEAALDSYLASLNRINPDELSPDAQLAFYINAYNAYTVKLIVDNFSEGRPPSSIKRIGGLFSSPWKIKFAGINGEQLSLDAIEHGIIRVRFAEPRIHFAVNCASKSCPPLLAVPYRGETIDAQLTGATQAFLEDQEFNYLADSILHLSPIFKWYDEDFKAGPVAFFGKYTSAETQAKLRAAGTPIRVKYLDYDWSLNGR